MSLTKRLKDKFTSSFAPVEPSVGMAGSHGLDNEFSALDFGDNYLDSRKRSRDDQNRDAANVKSHQDLMDSIAASAKGKYESGALSTGQQAQVDRFKQIQTAQLKQALGEKGIGNSSTAILEKGNLDNAAIGMKDSMLDQEFLTTMKALGLSDEASLTIAKMNSDERGNAISAYNSFMNAIGSVGGSV